MVEDPAAAGPACRACCGWCYAHSRAPEKSSQSATKLRDSTAMDAEKSQPIQTSASIAPRRFELVWIAVAILPRRAFAFVATEPNPHSP